MRTGIVTSLTQRHEASERIVKVLRREGLHKDHYVSLELGPLRQRVARVLGEKSRPARWLSKWDRGQPAHSCAPLAEVRVAIEARMARGRPMRWHWGLRNRQQAIDRAVAKHVLEEGTTGFFGSQGASLRCVRAARGRKIPGVIFMAAPVWAWNDVLEGEAALTATPAERDEIVIEARGFHVPHDLAEAMTASTSIVESHWMADGMMALGVPAETILPLAQGVDIQRFQPAPRDAASRPLRVLQIGRVGRLKGVHYSAEAVRRADPGVVERYTVVGPDNQRADTLRSRFPEMNWLGYLPFERLRREQDEADVFLTPTLADNMPRAVLEAMAAGLPVIVTPESGYGDIVTDGVEGFIVPSRSPDAIAEKLALLSRDGELRRRMGLAARALAERYSWEAYEERFTKALDGPLRALRSR